MTGSTLRHAALTLNIGALLKAHLKASACCMFTSDVKVRVVRDQAYYPDDVVTCDPRHTELTVDQSVIEAPLLLVEVVAESTAGVYRRVKLFSYRNLPSLKEYALVSQTERKVEVFRRTGDVGWEQRIYDATETVDLASVDLLLTMDDIYEDSGL